MSDPIPFPSETDVALLRDRLEKIETTLERQSAYLKSLVEGQYRIRRMLENDRQERKATEQGGNPA